MTATIYKMIKTPTQSGQAKIDTWILEYNTESSVFVEPIMGWTGNNSTLGQIKLEFSSKESAMDYATKYSLNYSLIEPTSSKIKIQSYIANFIA